MFIVVALLALLAADSSEYKQSVEAWRAKREAGLKRDDGWLTVAGLFWLKEGRNTAGSATDNDIVLPSGPGRLGVFEMRQGKVSWIPQGGAPRLLESDVAGKPTIVEQGRLSMHVIVRGKRTGVRLRDQNSKFRREFTSLRWYPVKPEYYIVAKWVPYAPPKRTNILDVQGTETEISLPGYAEFTLQGRTLRLEPTEEGAQFFFVFRDATSRDTTYQAARYLYADRRADGAVVLDFNRAYNPPCAFTPYATCPLPHPQNRLPVRIEAGELRYAKH